MVDVAEWDRLTAALRPAEAAPAAAGQAAQRPLTERGKTGRSPTGGGGPFVPLDDLVEEGEFITRPRGCTAYDPHGCRPVDVKRVEQLLALVRQLDDRRWVFLTLTVDRKKFTGPAEAYDVMNECTRRVVKGLGLLYAFTVFEVQGKTGDGWPHWHILGVAPDRSLDRSEKAFKRDAHRLWTRPRVDRETGELFPRDRVPAAGRKGIHVEIVKSAIAKALHYLTKYVLKPWEAVPAWMGESTRQIRKLRLSRSCLDELARMGLHVPKRGARKVATSRRRPARTLFVRMASSGARSSLLQKRGGRIRHVATVKVPACVRVLAEMELEGAEPLRMGVKVARCPVRIPAAMVPALIAGRFAEESERVFQQQLYEVRARWDEHQRERRERGE